MPRAILVERLRAVAKEFAGLNEVYFPGAERDDDEYVRLLGGNDPDQGRRIDVSILLDYVADMTEE